MDRIKQLKTTGTTIIFVSHDISAIRVVCERAIWLHKGTIKMTGDVFPVTAEYTKFIFAGNDLKEKSLKVLPEELQTASNEVSQLLSNSQPINQWGSHPGIIKKSTLAGVDERTPKTLAEKDGIKISITFDIPDNIDRSYLSVAFSIKNTKGTDLIVSATWDQNQHLFDNLTGSVTVEFKMKNHLNSGEYLLVTAVEDRSGATIHYYEYIEGAHYFSSEPTTKRMGLFLPSINQTIIDTPQ